MMRLFVLLTFWTFPALAETLYADLPDQSTTHCGYVLDNDPAAKVDVPVGSLAGAKVCAVDLSSVPPGQHQATLTAVVIEGAFRRESVPAGPLAFSVPITPAAPANLRIVR